MRSLHTESQSIIYSSDACFSATQGLDSVTLFLSTVEAGQVIGIGSAFNARPALCRETAIVARKGRIKVSLPPSGRLQTEEYRRYYVQSIPAYLGGCRYAAATTTVL